MKSYNFKSNIFFLLLFFLFSFCKEDSKILQSNSIKGKVIDAFNKLPIDSAKIYLYQYDYSTNPYTINVFKDTVSNNNGYFDIYNYKVESYLKVFKERYKNSTEMNAEDFINGQKIIELEPDMFVNLRLINSEGKWSNVLVYILDTFNGGNYNVNLDQESDFDSTKLGLKIYEDYFKLRYRVSHILPNSNEIYEIRSIPILLESKDTINVTITF